MKALICLFFILSSLCTWAQVPANTVWWNPENSEIAVIGGKGWHTNMTSIYDRLPAYAQAQVRPAVWNLSKNTAGTFINFTTDAAKITVRYAVSGLLNMPHMPSTGVSGLDLYAIDTNNNWHWAKGYYNFNDTITYTFSNINTSIPIKAYRLYLPLYNTPKWLEIGVEAGKSFTPLPINIELPIVLYGTSIMQGACASRPGIAWSNILGRKLNLPLVNLGFSGNGRLEPEIIDLVSELESRLFVLDCQPNLHDRNTYTAKEIQFRITQSVLTLQKKHPKTPILLVEHSGAIQINNLDTSLTNKFLWTSNILAETFTQLKNDGLQNIFLLTSKAIGFDSESTVDGTHPTDIGMRQYALAYEKIIRTILKL